METVLKTTVVGCSSDAPLSFFLLADDLLLNRVFSTISSLIYSSFVLLHDKSNLKILFTTLLTTSKNHSSGMVHPETYNCFTY